jgi:glycosyltransferase involved in cell wall biosynthesis
MIIQVIGSLRGGGAEKIALTLHKGFKRLGKKSKLIVLNNKIDHNIDDEDIIIDNDLNIIEKYNPKLIISHMQDSAEKLKTFEDKNIYYVIHTTLSYRLKQKKFFSRIKYLFKLKKLYNNKNLICVSNGVKEDILNNLNIKPKTIQTIYNPFDIEEIQTLGNEKIDLNFDYIINVAGLTKVKNQALLLKSFAKLDTNLHLVLLGKGNQEKNLKQLSKKLKIENRVHFLGWQKNPYKYIKNAKLFVLSSNIEGFGNVIVESLILHTRVVSTNCPSGPNEILVDELSKYLAKVKDENDLKEKIESALNYYPQIEEKFYKKFDYLNIANQYSSVI